VVLERLARVALGAVVAAAGVYVLYRLRFVLVTVTLAVMLAYAILPAVDVVERLRVGGHGLPRFGAALLVALVVLVLLAGGAEVVARPLGEEVRRFMENAAAYRTAVSTWLTGVRGSLDQILPPGMREALDDAISRAGTLLVDALAHGVRATVEWTTHVAEIILIPILAFYFMVDQPVLERELVGFLPPVARPAALQAARRLGHILAVYVRGQIILMLIAGVVVSVALAALGVRFSLLLGVIAGVTRAVPIIGPVIGAIPIVGMALLQSPTVGMAVLLFFIALQVVESKLILPLVIGHELNLHAATIILALLVGNGLFGLLGMFLAPPVAAFLREFVALASGEEGSG
jgi:predicted PurR-regulated permease PerM